MRLRLTALALAALAAGAGWWLVDQGYLILGAKFILGGFLLAFPFALFRR